LRHRRKRPRDGKQQRHNLDRHTKR
jgi:hypothetical protein